MHTRIENLTGAVTVRASAEDGQTMVEYGLLTVGIALAVLVAVQLLGAHLLSLFDSFAGAL
jgi:Flp pilus assembly pilin Flp